MAYWGRCWFSNGVWVRRGSKQIDAVHRKNGEGPRWSQAWRISWAPPVMRIQSLIYIVSNKGTFINCVTREAHFFDPKLTPLHLVARDVVNAFVSNGEASINIPKICGCSSVEFSSFTLTFVNSQNWPSCAAVYLTTKCGCVFETFHLTSQQKKF